MRQPLTLAGPLVDELRDYARAASPREACGLLGGDTSSGVARTFHPVRNVAESAYLYVMDPGEAVRVLDGMAAVDEELVAIVHSHPTSPASPSPTDVREAAWPGVAHLIVSLDERVRPEARLRAWSVSDGRAEEIRLLRT